MTGSISTEVIEARMPYPIASIHRRIRNLDENAYMDRLDMSLKLYEVVLKTLASIVVESYLLDGAFDPQFNSKVNSFSRPSLGHWAELLREGLKLYKERQTPALTEAIRGYYQSKLSPDSREIARRLVNLLSKPYNGKVSSVGAVMDLLGTLRNELAHGAPLTSAENRERLELVDPIVTKILDGASFLVDFTLLYIDEVRVVSGEFDHIVQRCMGLDFERQRFRSEAALDSGYLYLCQIGEDGAPTFALPLSPFLILAFCGDCKHLQVFFFNGSSGKRIEFLSYQCGHLYIPVEHIVEFTNISDFLAGKISLSTLFKGRTIGKELPRTSLGATDEERTKAARLVNHAIIDLNDGLHDEAITRLHSAIELDQDDAEAHFYLGTAMLIKDGNADAALTHYNLATQLNPDFFMAHLALARVYEEKGETLLARKAVERAMEIDATDYRVAQLVERLEAASGGEEPL